MRHSQVAIALAAATLGLGACNTMQGLGRDLEAGGRAMARTAAQTQADMQATRADIAPDTVTPPLASLTATQARARALSARPGAIEKEEVSNDQSGARYTFHIRGEDGGLYVVAVDAQTGAATETQP